MRPAAAILAIILAFSATAADYVDVVVSTTDFGLGKLVGTNVTMTPVGPVRRTYGTNMITLTAKTLATDTDGVATFTNTLWGKYDLTVPGTTPTTWRLNLGTNHTATVSAAALVTDAAAYPPDPATNYYTMAQVDALIEDIVVVGQTNWPASAITNATWLTNGQRVWFTNLGLAHYHNDSVAFSITNENNVLVWSWTPNNLFAYDPVDGSLAMQIEGADGNAVFRGDVWAKGFKGDGSAVTNLNGTNITAGTVETNALSAAAYAALVGGGSGVAGGVTSLNTQTGAVVVAGSSNITVTTAGGTVTVDLSGNVQADIAAAQAAGAMYGSNSVNIKDAPFLAKGDGVTDDTEAIQAAINSITNTGGTVWAPDGLFRIAGEFKLCPGTSDSYAQLTLPFVNPDFEASTNYGPYRVIRISGVNSPAHSTILSTNGAVFLSTRIPTTTNCSIIGCGGTITNSIWGVNGIHPWIEKLTLRATQDPNLIALDMNSVGQCTLDDLWIDSGVSWTNLLAAGTTHFGYGVRMPKVLNNVIARARHVDVQGFHTGFKMSEFSAFENCRAWQCDVGFELGQSMAAISAQNMLAFWCHTNILATAKCWINFADFEWETASETRGPQWTRTNHWHLWEATNYTHGIITTCGFVAGGEPSYFKRPLWGNSQLQVNNMGYSGFEHWGNVQIAGQMNFANYATPGVYRRTSKDSSGTDPGPYLCLLAETNGVRVLSHDFKTWLGAITPTTGFTGNGSGLTNLNASSLASGTVPTARLCGAQFDDYALIGTNIVISPTNGNLQSWVITEQSWAALDAADTNYTETIRLNVYGSNTVTWTSANLSNTASLGPSNSISVMLFDHSRGTNLWWGMRIR